MKIIALAVLLLVAPLFAQTAKVIALSPEDAAKAKSLADRKAALEQEQAAFDKEVETKYITVEDNAGHGTCVVGNTVLSANWSDAHARPMPKIRWYLYGWGCGGFLYSSDYRYIVPKPGSRESQPLGPSWIQSAH